MTEVSRAVCRRRTVWIPPTVAHRNQHDVQNMEVRLVARLVVVPNSFDPTHWLVSRYEPMILTWLPLINRPTSLNRLQSIRIVIESRGDQRIKGSFQRCKTYDSNRLDFWTVDKDSQVLPYAEANLTDCPRKWFAFRTAAGRPNTLTVFRKWAVAASWWRFFRCCSTVADIRLERMYQRCPCWWWFGPEWVSLLASAIGRQRIVVAFPIASDVRCSTIAPQSGRGLRWVNLSAEKKNDFNS